MSVISKVNYSGLNVRNAEQLKDFEREEKLNGKLSAELKKKANKLIEKNEEKANVGNHQKSTLDKMIHKEGVSYEKTIYDSASIGVSFIQSIEKQFTGTKFFIGTVSYGQTYGNSSDTNFVINPYFLERLGSDETVRKQFEEDVKYLSEFSRMFREQQLSQGREIVNQGWFCDENGNWGGWCISKPVKQPTILQDMTDYAEEIRQKKLEEQKEIEQKLKEYFGERFLGFRVKWLEEDIKEEVAELQESESDSEKESESMSVSVGVNVGKTARKISAAKTTEQLRMVIAEIRNDMRVVKDGMKKGYCDESEMAKVEMLMSMAQSRMGQVEDREATPEEETAFSMASLM